MLSTKVAVVNTLFRYGSAPLRFFITFFYIYECIINFFDMYGILLQLVICIVLLS